METLLQGHVVLEINLEHLATGLYFFFSIRVSKTLAV